MREAENREPFMSVSLVIPVYNEAESLPHLHTAIHQVMKGLKQGWEVVFIDDGSIDTSLDVLKALAEQDTEHVRIVVLRRNFGQTAAIAAGIDHSSGNIIVLLDADLQNDPADIPMMLQKLDDGYDVVSGWRIKRQDTFITRTLPSRIANGLISWVTGVHLHDYGCTLKAYRREVLTGFRLYGEMHRFIPVYAHSVGAKILEVKVNHHPRKYGRTKYGLERTIKVLLDLFTVKFLVTYAKKPIYLFGGTGIAMMALSAMVLLWLFFRRILVGTEVLTSPFFQTSVMFVILGFQSILMGLIAELLVRTYHESQAKPTYTVRTVISPQGKK